MRERNTTSPLLVAGLCAFAWACTAQIVSDDEGSTRAPGGGPGGGSEPVGENPGGVSITCDTSVQPGVSPLMKLSTVQYRNTVRDLLAAVGAAEALPEVEPLLASIPDDSAGDGFRGLDDRISLEHVQGYFNVGVALADAITSEPGLLTAIAGECAAEATLTQACVDGFLDSFVRLAYRSPLSDAERSELGALNDGVRSPAQAVRAMIVVALSSPRFVNHVEIDGEPIDDVEDLLQLAPHEVAARLSYTFWQTMPDAELRAAADDGTLASDEGFAAQLERVFADPRTRETLWQFWNEWLRFEKFTGFETARPALQALAEGELLGEPGHDHYADMVQEMRDLTELFTFGQSAPLSELLTTDVSVTTSADLARLYGVEPWSGAGDYPRLTDRSGLLQRAALLVSNLEQTNPFHRGATVRRHLLCDELPQPDPNTLPPGSLDPPPPSSAQTTRERFQAKVEGNSLCQGCHGSFSDIGYVLESFDALGRFRTAEKIFDEQTGELLAELPIDTSAVARVDLGDDRPVADATELNQRIVDSRKVEACLAKHYFAYTSRRLPDSGSLDACVVQDLSEGLADESVGLAGAFQRLARYASFFQRKVGEK